MSAGPLDVPGPLPFSVHKKFQKLSAPCWGSRTREGFPQVPAPSQGPCMFVFCCHAIEMGGLRETFPASHTHHTPVPKDPPGTGAQRGVRLPRSSWDASCLPLLGRDRAGRETFSGILPVRSLRALASGHGMILMARVENWLFCHQI